MEFRLRFAKKGVRIDRYTTRYKGPYFPRMGGSYYVEKRTWGDLDAMFPWVALATRGIFISRHRTRGEAEDACSLDALTGRTK